jgi:hypothetical protein
MNWQERFDRLLKAMSQGEPHKAEKREPRRPTGSNNKPRESETP